MTDLIVAILGAGGAILLLKLYDNYTVDKGQKKLDDKVKESDKVQAGLEGEQRQEDKETQEKVNEINDEQNDKPSGSGLSDWFNRRK